MFHAGKQCVVTPEGDQVLPPLLSAVLYRPSRAALYLSFRNKYIHLCSPRQSKRRILSFHKMHSPEIPVPLAPEPAFVPDPPITFLDEKAEVITTEDVAASSRPGRAPSFTKEEEDKVIRKLDWNIMPLVFVLYSLSVLDRTNLGNARIAGMKIFGIISLLDSKNT